MPTYREYYFKLKKNNLFTDEVIFSLFQDVSGLNRTDLILNFDKEILYYVKLDSMIERIEKGEPYQYVLGYTTFLKNKFYVNPSVLIPRQETEQLVLDLYDFLSKSNSFSKLNILDMCSGSGVIGISLAMLLNTEVDMVDISKSANQVAELNNESLKTNCHIYESDLFKNLTPKKYNVIVSNPPYIRSEETVDPKTLEYEPHLALFASPSTYFYEEIFKAKSVYLEEQFLMGFEIGEDMEDELTKLIHLYFDNVSYIFKKDIYGRTRFLYIWSK